MFGTRTREDVVSASSALLGSLHPLYKTEYRRVPLEMKLAAADIHSPATLEVSDPDGHSLTVTGEKPQIAEKAPFSGDYAKKMLGKTGGTPYYLGEFHSDLPEGLTLPSPALSAMKRNALEKLDALRRKPEPVPFDSNRENCRPTARRSFGDGKPELRVIFRSIHQMPDDLSGVSMVYLPLETDAATLAGAIEIIRANGKRPAVEAPRGFFGAEEAIEQYVLQAKELGVKDIMIHNIGLLPMMKKHGMRIHGGFGLNVFNSRSLDEYASLGLTDSELSFELTLGQITALASGQPRGMIIRGRIPMMITRNCPAALSPKGCMGYSRNGGPDGRNCSITDRTGRELPVLCRTGCSEIFNPVMMSVAENVAGKSREELSLDWVTLSFTTESREECTAVIGGFVKGAPAREPGITAGLYFKGVQ